MSWWLGLPRGSMKSMYVSATDRQGIASIDAKPGCDLSGAHNGSLARSAGVIRLAKVSSGRRVATVLSRMTFSR